MREILFRGKRTDNGELVYGFYAKSGDKTFIIVDNDIAVGYVTMKEVITETVGQYTGLTDCNGKRIFEGDIIKMGLAICTISYDAYNGRYMLYERGKYKRDGFNADTMQLKEVIGNIHDNPELLEQ